MERGKEKWSWGEGESERDQASQEEKGSVHLKELRELKTYWDTVLRDRCRHRLSRMLPAKRVAVVVRSIPQRSLMVLLDGG
jgi:hypothetical protein